MSLYLVGVEMIEETRSTMSLHTFDTRFVLRAVEQRDHWNSFVDEHPAGHLLQSWGWGELKAYAGWQPLRLGLWDTHEQRMVAGAQVLRRTVPHVPLRVGHLAYIPKGPLLDWSQHTQCEAFFTHMTALLRTHGAIAVCMDVPQRVESAESELVVKRLEQVQAHPIPSVQPLRTIVLDVTADEETLLAHMKEKWRYNVRLGKRKGVTVRVAERREEVEAWYHLMQTTSERDSFGIHTLEYYLHVWDVFVAEGHVKLFLAEHEGQLLAGIFVGLFARQSIYLYGASSNEQRQLMPNYVLQWEAIRWAKRAGALSYDFWGIPETDAEDEAMAGVYRFKRGWGGQVVQFLGGYEQVYRPFAMKLARRFLP